MIIKQFQLAKIINPKLFQSFLIYGPNEGLVRDNIDKLYKSFSDDSECERLYITNKQIDEDPTVLQNEMDSISMFSSKKFITLESLKEKHSNLIKDCLSRNYENIFLIVKLDNLNKSSKIRNIYETSKNHYALACYEDDIKVVNNIARIIEIKFTTRSSLN